MYVGYMCASDELSLGQFSHSASQLCYVSKLISAYTVCLTSFYKCCRYSISLDASLSKQRRKMWHNFSAQHQLQSISQAISHLLCRTDCAEYCVSCLLPITQTLQNLSCLCRDPAMIDTLWSACHMMLQRHECQPELEHCGSLRRRLVADIGS